MSRLNIVNISNYIDGGVSPVSRQDSGFLGEYEGETMGWGGEGLWVDKRQGRRERSYSVSILVCTILDLRRKEMNRITETLSRYGNENCRSS